MKLTAHCLTLVIAATASAARAGTAEEEGLALAQRADRANEGYGTERASLTMELVNAHGDVTTRRLAIEALEGKDDGDRSRAIFEWPADVKGTKMLTYSHKRADDDQWLYLPAVK